MFTKVKMLAKFWSNGICPSGILF